LNVQFKFEERAPASECLRFLVENRSAEASGCEWDVAAAGVDARAAGRVLCESPKMEDDALVIKRTWERLAKKP
jgi:hypothetical protein